MKAKDVMKVLQISRATLYRYVKAGTIKVDCEINGQYRYNAESVFGLLGKPVPDTYK
jgi:predicted site-specific integrase-resolvase